MGGLEPGAARTSVLVLLCCAAVLALVAFAGHDSHRAALVGKPAVRKPAGEMGKPIMGKPTVSHIRHARIRQLALERERGTDFDKLKERPDGEDEQQSGIEAMQFGPGWGPEMDVELGGQVVDEDALDAADDNSLRVAANTMATPTVGIQDKVDDFEKEIVAAVRQVAHLNQEADEAERDVEAVHTKSDGGLVSQRTGAWATR